MTTTRACCTTAVWIRDGAADNPSYVTGFISRNGIRFDPKVMGQDEREIIRDAAENSSYGFGQVFLYRYISAGLDKLIRASA